MPKQKIHWRVLLPALLLWATCAAYAQEDFIRSGTGIGVERTRVAVSSFRAAADSAALLRTFDETLWNDLEYSGILDLVSRSFYPLTLPARPGDVKLEEWSRPPVSAHMLVLGSIYRLGERLMIEGWLVDPLRSPRSIDLPNRV